MKIITSNLLTNVPILHPMIQLITINPFKEGENIIFQKKAGSRSGSTTSNQLSFREINHAQKNLVVVNNNLSQIF